MSGKMLWLDLETISLDPTDPILEVGMRVTDEKFETLAQLDLVVKRSLYRDPTSKKVALCDGNPVEEIVADMHEKSGLWDEVEKSPHDFYFVSNAASEFAREHFPQGKIILSGSSTHFDRGYVKKQMNALESQLHYRLIDVSSMTELLKICYGYETPKADSKHRSIPDIEDSIRRIKCCFEFLRSK